MDKHFFIFDDHKMTRLGLRTFIEQNSDWRFVGEAGSYEEAVSAIDSFRAADGAVCVAIVDASFHDSGSSIEKALGFDIIRYIKKSGKGIKCIVYSSTDTGAFVQYVMGGDVGADGYVSKNDEDNSILTAMGDVSLGRQFIQGNLITPFLQANVAMNSLTKKEKEVLNLVTQGASNESVAGILKIQVRTVENYLSRIYDKLGVSERDSLSKWHG